MDGLSARGRERMCTASRTPPPRKRFVISPRGPDVSRTQSTFPEKSRVPIGQHRDGLRRFPGERWPRKIIKRQKEEKTRLNDVLASFIAQCWPKRDRGPATELINTQQRARLIVMAMSLTNNFRRVNGDSDVR